MATLQLDFDPRELASQVFARQAHDYYAALPKPDPQFAVAYVAEVLDVKPETVRGYLELAATEPAHPRALPYVDTTGTPRGFRVPLSEITAWQQRNRPGSQPLELPVRRPARRQAA